MSHACHRFWKCYKTLTFCSLLTRCTIPCTCHAVRAPGVFHILTSKCASRDNTVHFFDISTSKSGPIRIPGVFPILTSKCASCHNDVHFFDISTSKSGPDPWCFQHFDFECASRHNGVHFFNISISKSGPRMVCFVHFDFEMCFAPQRRALFRHLNLQKWREHVVFCTCSLRNVLRATTACTFSTFQFPKVVRSWCVLYILTSKRASRHNRMQFFICHLASWLRTRRFSEPTFRPQCFATFLPFRAPGSSLTFSCLIFSLLLFSSLFFCSTSAFHLSTLSEV